MKIAIAGALLTLSLLAMPALAQDLKEFRCGRLLEAPDGIATMAVDDQLHVLDQTNTSPTFDPGPAPAGMTIKSIFCARSDVVPAQSDYKVVQAGFPFTIYARDPDGKTRIAVLELNEGQLRLRSVGEKGFTSEMVHRIQAFLDQSLPQLGKPVATR
jgi:hypothetical protein